MLKARHLALALLATAAIPTSSALAEITWRQTTCPDSQVYLFDWMECRISAEDTTDRNLRGTARHYATLGRTGDAAAGFVLSMPQDGMYTAYPQTESETIIKATASAGGRRIDTWGPYAGFDKTGYMTFTSDAMNCVGFDHGGPFTRPDGGSASQGYAYLLRGYFCERAPIPDAKRRLVQYLEAVRIGRPGAGRNALGGEVVALKDPLWQAAAGAPMPPVAASAFPQPVTLGGIPVATTAATTTVSAPILPGESPARMIPGAVAWDGIGTVGSARMVPEGTGRSAALSFGMPASTSTCSGTVVSSMGGIGIPGPAEGTWSAACSDGETVSGTYRSDISGKATAVGLDSKGRKVQLNFGG